MLHHVVGGLVSRGFIVKKATAKISAAIHNRSRPSPKKKERDTVLNTVLNTHTTIRIVKSFSTPPEKAHTLAKFCEVSRLEPGSRLFSQFILKALEEYNHKHEAGSPQHKLTPYIDETAESPMYVLCHDVDGAISDGRVHCKRAGMWIQGLRCYSCKRNRLKKSKQRSPP